MSALRPTSQLKHDLRSLALFLLITFAITWGIIGSYIIWPAWMAAQFGEISGLHPLFFLATWAPAISAFTLVFIKRGWGGVQGFLSRVLMWRCPIGWWFIILVVIPGVFITGSLIKGGDVLAEFRADEIRSVVLLLFIMLMLGPVEEFGWRGIAQPLLQRHLAPLYAGGLIGVIWGIWHLPAFYLAGLVFSEWQFLPFFLGNITLAILVTPLFNATQGSLLLPMLFHWQLVNPLWPDAQPWDTWLLMIFAIAIILSKRLWVFRRGEQASQIIGGIGRTDL